MRVFLLGNAAKPRVPEIAEELRTTLENQCDVVVFDLTQSVDLSQCEADLAFVLGGDGAILGAARQMGYRQVPVLGINLGKLGFLADLSPDEVREALPGVLAGNYRVTRHLMFECIVTHNSESRTFIGLNEIVVQAGYPFNLIEIDLTIAGERVGTFSGDGLILSTPVGSTAHSLSAGGPILRQDLQAFVVTPICPHGLTYRPLVDAADKTYGIKIRRGTPNTVLIVDGREVIAVGPEHEITVRQAPVQFQLIKTIGHSYYKTLHEKLHWGNPPGRLHEPS